MAPRLRIWSFFWCISLTFCAVLIPGYFFQEKYARVIGRCTSNWINTLSGNLNSTICCEHSTYNFSNRPCYFGMHHFNILTSFLGGWIFPLVIPLLRLVTSCNSSLKFKTIFNRILFYIGIMSYRTFVLYGVVNFIENLVFSPIPTCWYSSLRRNGKCMKTFDYADHIVLYVVHFIGISMFEYFAITLETTSKLIKQFYTICISLVMLLSFYLIFHTSYSFHTLSESIFALILAQVFALFPLYLVMKNSSFTRNWFPLNRLVFDVRRLRNERTL